MSRAIEKITVRLTDNLGRGDSDLSSPPLALGFNSKFKKWNWNHVQMKLTANEIRFIKQLSFRYYILAVRCFFILYWSLSRRVCLWSGSPRNYSWSRSFCQTQSAITILPPVFLFFFFPFCYLMDKKLKIKYYDICPIINYRVIYIKIKNFYLNFKVSHVHQLRVIFFSKYLKVNPI